MKKILEYSNHRNPKDVRVGEMDGHSYFIPFESPQKAAAPRQESAYFYPLNENWLFQWKPSLYEMDDFYINDYDASHFSPLSLPENWQLHGCDSIQYQSSPYPFIFDPPNIPEKNPCAAYLKDFDFFPTDKKRYELHIEGKDSCVYVYLNGSFVGYGEAPHNTSIFDVTPFLKEGRNRLCMLVLKWCSGSYLDDQDKIRLSGIFREVYILERDPDGIRDFLLTADCSGKVRLTVNAAATVNARIYNGSRLVYSGQLTENQEAVIQIKEPILWSAESPHLYTLLLHCREEYISHRFGLREVSVQNGVFTINGTPVKLRGVNRHDSFPDTGYVASLSRMRAELIQMKQNNINSIRTSHYPNDPRFYEMCDELGFYVMSEADLEAHGCAYADGWDPIVNHPQYADAIRDRILRMYDSLKNYTCIFCWSLGNESYWGENFKQPALELKAADPARVLHYERICTIYRQDKLGEEDKNFLFENFDFFSLMYATLERSAKIFEDQRIKIPFLLCEYSHAMGNSCGDLRFYEELFLSDDRYAGGYIWEWCDHGVRLSDEKGREYFGFGGDFGEKHHKKNVCVDGLVSPERLPHSSLLEMKAVYAPVRVTRNEDGILTIHNRNFFTDFSQYRVEWTVTADNVTADRGVLSVNPGPGKSVLASLPTREPYQAENAALTVTIKTAYDSLWADAGHIVAAFSFPLQTKPDQIAVSLCTPPVLTETCTGYTVTGEGFSYSFRKDEGMLTQMTIRGTELLESPLSLNCFRAPTDNDNSLTDANNMAVRWNLTYPFGCIEYPEISVRNFCAQADTNTVVLSGDFIFAVQGRKHISTGKIVCRIFGDGRLRIEQTGKISEELPYFLPRYGYTFAFREPLSDIIYYGYGPAECYEDKRSHALLGQYSYLPDAPAESYEYPQEQGSHCDTKWVRFCFQDNVIQIRSNKFSFCASNYDIHEMALAKHKKDLTPCKGTSLYIDYRMSGVGSASCGGWYAPESCRINPGEEVDFAIEVSIL